MRAVSPGSCNQSAVLEGIIRDVVQFIMASLEGWPMDPSTTSANIIDDHVDELLGNRFVHFGKEPSESSMLVSR